MKIQNSVSRKFRFFTKITFESEMPGFWNLVHFYAVIAPFALITASKQRGMEMISLWHSRGDGRPGCLDSRSGFSHLHLWSIKYHGLNQPFSNFSSLDRCKVLIDKEISFSLKVSAIIHTKNLTFSRYSNFTSKRTVRNKICLRT